MKTYFTQEALDAVKEKISKFQAGGTTSEIRPDNRSWIRNNVAPKKLKEKRDWSVLVKALEENITSRPMPE